MRHSFDLGQLTESETLLLRNRIKQAFRHRFCHEGEQEVVLLQTKEHLAGNSSKLVSLCPDDRLSVECIFQCFFYFTNPISVFYLLLFHVDFNGSFNFNEKAEFCSGSSSMVKEKTPSTLRMSNLDDKVSQSPTGYISKHER